MEVLGELAEAGGALRWAALPAAADVALASDGGGSGDIARILALLAGLSSTAVADTTAMGFREAADFAARVEEIARRMGYLQVVAAGAVDRTRREASAAVRAGFAVGWSTGWGEATAVHGPIGWAATSAESRQSAETAGLSEAAGPAEPDPVDDGCRNAAEFLRLRLRISAAEARRRLALAELLLPGTGITGHVQEPVRPVLAAAAAAVAAGTVASRAATIITLAMDKVRHHAPEDTLSGMEHALTRTAAESDADVLTRVARHWTDAIDQDGAEPTEAELRHRQGVFIRRTLRGLHSNGTSRSKPGSPGSSRQPTLTHARSRDQTTTSIRVRRQQCKPRALEIPGSSAFPARPRMTSGTGRTSSAVPA